MDSGARFNFLSTDIPMAINGGPNTTLGLVLKPSHYCTDRRHHSSTTTVQRVADFTMCPLNYCVYKPVTEVSTELLTTQGVTLQSIAFFGMQQRNCQAMMKQKLDCPTIYHKQAWTHKRVRLAPEANHDCTTVTKHNLQLCPSGSSLQPLLHYNG